MTRDKEQIMKTHTILAIAAAAALSTGTAFAQSVEESTPSIQRTGSLSQVPVVPTGYALQVGGGVTGFSRQSARNEFGVGGYWDARAIFGARSFLGAEAAYVGSARGISVSGVSNNAALLGNGAEGVVRGNLPLTVGKVELTPFVFGGVGWTYYQVSNNSGPNSSGIRDHANALVIPFGAGTSATYDHVLVDARFTYRVTPENNLVPSGTGDHLDMQNWSAGATVGYEF